PVRPGGRGPRAPRPLPRPRLGLHSGAQPLALPRGGAAGPLVQCVPAAVPGRAPPPRTGAGGAGTWGPTARGAGLLAHVGLSAPATREHIGARQARFLVAPGSSLHRRPAAWVMAGELVETTRLWARMVARIDPAWIEPLASHLVKRSYSEAWWDPKQAAALTSGRVTLS